MSVTRSYCAFTAYDYILSSTQLSSLPRLLPHQHQVCMPKHAQQPSRPLIRYKDAKRWALQLVKLSQVQIAPNRLGQGITAFRRCVTVIAVYLAYVCAVVDTGFLLSNVLQIYASFASQSTNMMVLLQVFWIYVRAGCSVSKCLAVAFLIRIILSFRVDKKVSNCRRDMRCFYVRISCS